AHFSRAADRYTAKLHEEQVLFGGPDYGVNTLTFHAHAMWCLGLADQGLRTIQKAVELAHQLKHPFGRVTALAYLAMFHHFRRESDLVGIHAQAALDLATRMEANYYGIWALILICWVEAWENPGQAQIAALQTALDDFRATGAAVRWPYYLSLLAEI